jgi:GNAT superfamily N-acetyltransferase
MKRDSDMQYTLLKAAEIGGGFFGGFIRRQDVTKCLRLQNGRWTVTDDPFTDDWSEAEYAALLAELREIARRGGGVIGAFSDGKLRGFAAVVPEPMGKSGEYLDLPYIHVSADARGKGIGRELFDRAKAWAKARGAKKLYISAHSSVESQAFYMAMGCADAKEINPEHAAREPYDRQMECVL